MGTSITLFRLSCRPDKLQYDWAESEKIFELDGPMPRLFQKKKLEAIKKWSADRDYAIDNLGYDTLKNLFSTTPTDIPNSSRLSHELFLISRKNLEGSHAGRSDRAVISIITPNVKRMLLHKLLDYRRDQKLIELWREQEQEFYRIASGAAWPGRLL